MDRLRELYDREDFNEVYLRLSNDIKIRKYRHLKDLPEINDLPSHIQDKIYSAANGLKFNHETIRDEGNIYSTAYVVLFDQGEENWLGMFKYDYATTVVKIVELVLGAGVLIGGIWYFSAAAAKYLNSVIGYISQNYKATQDSILKYAGILFSAAAYREFVKWLMNEHSEWNMLIASCILKKLESVRGS